MMATSSGTRIAGRSGRSFLELDGGTELVGRGVCGDSVGFDGVCKGDWDEDKSITEGVEKDCEKVALDGIVPIGPAPV